MRNSRVTIRYAKALLQLAIEQNILEQCYKDMLLLDSVFRESKDLSLLLKSPIVKTDQKLSIFKQIFESKIGEVSMAFINIITTKKREGLLALISSSFISLYKSHKKIETALVTTATPLDDTLRKEVINFIKKHSHDNIELTEKIDKKIIGGAIIRMGDKQLDASVSKAISELRQSFNSNLYLQDL